MKKNVYLLILLSFSFLTFSICFAEVKTPKNPKSAKGCAICHFRWIDTFFIEGKGSALVSYQSEKVAASPEMCLSCHDGSVMDSRKKMTDNLGHKTNIPPPSDMIIPKIFPLDEKGRMQCATCHTAHGVPSGEGMETTIFMRTSNKDSAMCRMCHADMDGGLAAGQHPIGNVQKEIPEKLIHKGAALGHEENRFICETCHKAHGSPYSGFLVDSDGDSSLCLDCHNDKNILTPDGKKRATHVINLIPKKAKIPESLIKKGAKLGYNGAISCQTCHKVHRNKIESQLLLIKKDNKSTLCLTCHGDKRYLADTKHNLINTAPKERNLQGKTVAQTGICSACHLPHRAARKLSGEKDYTSELCLSCHGKKAVAEKVNLSGKTHPLIINPFKIKNSGNILKIIDVKKNKLKLPLFNKVGVQDINGEMTCATCHNPHGSPADSIESKSGKRVKTSKKTYFLRRKAPDLCKECHRRKFAIANSKHDLKKSAPGAKNVLHQTPSESGLCGNCHLVHGSHKGYLWAREITENGDMSMQGLCKSCHQKKGIAKKKVHHGYSHPLDISPYKKGLTTNLPLFDKQGKLSESGVITCYTCHDPHCWDPLNKKVAPDKLHSEGDSRNSFLRLKNSPFPKLCGNCHTDKAYVEKTDHDLIISAPLSKNIIGQTPIESGTCGVCHLVHNSKYRFKLWGQNYGKGYGRMEAMCTSCHRDNGSGGNKIPQISSHPDKQIIHSTTQNIPDRHESIPLYDKLSGKPVPTGNISCPSCHNVHQWNPSSYMKGRGINLEGDATNSFLRQKSYDLPCKNCHGPDALFRYKYYHDVRKRKKK